MRRGLRRGSAWQCLAEMAASASAMLMVVMFFAHAHSVLNVVPRRWSVRARAAAQRGESRRVTCKNRQVESREEVPREKVIEACAASHGNAPAARRYAVMRR